MNLSAVIVKPGLWGLSKSDYRDIGRNAIEAAGLLWHTKFKPLHFQLEAFERYAYRRRSKKWEAQKAKIHPEAGGRPLVYSGQSEQLAKAANRIVARATTFDKYHADVTVSAPNLNFHANEMTRTTPEEDEALADKFHDEFVAGMVSAARENGTSARTIELWKSHAA